jgi:hypothetical protein
LENASQAASQFAKPSQQKYKGEYLFPEVGKIRQIHVFRNSG